jgi:hypothetical protein
MAGGHLMTLATQKPLIDVLFSIEMKLVLLGWAVIERSGERRLAVLTEPRVLKWAIAVCIRAGQSAEFIDRLLEETPPERHWRVIRMRLPESALYVLDGKLDGFLLSEET